MGFMGLSCTNDSDVAADLAYVANKAVAKVLQKGLKDPGNQWNTSGVVNVALYLEETVKTAIMSEELSAVIRDTIVGLKKVISLLAPAPGFGRTKRRLTQLMHNLEEIPQKD